MDSLADGINVPYEDSGIPIVVASGKILLGCLQVWLFLESLNLVDFIYGWWLCCGDIAIACFRAAWLDTDGNVGVVIGRLAGGVIMNYIQPRLVLLACAILTFVATVIVVVCSGTLSLIAFFALYLGESIMFPTIFSLALRDAGTKTKLASSLLIMTIVGGAVAPVIMGYIADTTGSMAIAFLIPLVCYGVIGGYALLKPSASL